MKYEGALMVISTKNTFIEIVDPNAQQNLPRSASCPPRCWKGGLSSEFDIERCGSDASTASLFDGFPATLSDDEGFPPTQPSSPSHATDAMVPFQLASPTGSTCSPTNSPREVTCDPADLADGADSPPLSPRKPRRRGRGRRSGKMEFGATLDKRTGGSHGIDIDWSNGTHLLVEKVNQAGTVAAWNAEHPEMEISAGHCIMEVNGVRGVAGDLLEEMKKEQLLEIKVRCPKRRPETPPASPSAEANAVQSSTTRTPLRSVLVAAHHAPIFQPVGMSSVSEVVPASTAMDASSASMWLAPQGMRAEFVHAVQALNTSLKACLPGFVNLDATSTAKVSFSAVTSTDSAAVLNSVQTTVLNTVAQFPNVFLMGRNANPFQALGDGEVGCRVMLCTIAKGSFPRTCWDMVGKGYCPYGCTCSWEHPTEADVLEVQISLQEVLRTFPPLRR
mmetsp:Transcript_17631/g.31876  ORF Transcript_17631/g.31876 Transcript_17631/m.31876 type:complete len:447 (-) Transcript_17631:328-1668(-)